MSLLDRLTEKSWETPGLVGHAEPQDHRPAAATVGLAVFLAVASVIFSLTIAAYLMRMGQHGVMGHGAESDWRPMPEPWLLWVNTGILVASSLAWERARRAAATGEIATVWPASVAGSVLGLAFLTGQLLLWRQYQAAGYFLAANPANAFFYLLSAVHGLHLAGGIAACVRTLGQFGRADEQRSRRNVQLCAVYWHFLLLVWALIAVLLMMT